MDKTETVVFSISRFLFKSLVNKNFCNSRTSNDADMKLGPLNFTTEIGRRQKMKMVPCEQNYDVTATFLIYDQFGAIWKPDSRSMVRNS